MSGPSSKAPASLMRHRTAIFAITAIAAGFIVYAIGDSLHLLPKLSKETSQKSTTSLHRSNARRRRSSRRPTNMNGHEVLHRISPDCIVSTTYERTDPIGLKVYGRCLFTTPNGSRPVWLNPPHLPPGAEIHEQWGVDSDQASNIRDYVERQLLDSFFAREMPSGAPGVLLPDARERFLAEFANIAQISPSTTEAAIDRYQTGALQDHAGRQAQTDGVEVAEPADTVREFSATDLAQAIVALTTLPTSEVGGDGSVADTESNHPHAAEGENEGRSEHDQNLMNLLYRIAENQSRKEGVVHHGIICNSCNAMPIRGIRYQCMNCHDYDLCEQCEALQVHEKTHIFYKVRIPAPFLDHPRQPAPVWYPGRPGIPIRYLSTEFKTLLLTDIRISERQLEAYWDQFQCLASSDYTNDPLWYGLAIDRDGFDQCFVPNMTLRPPPPNLVYDRMFSFYDTNNDGLIDFGEFLRGIACIEEKGKELQARIFRAYDVDGDGYADRKDFLRMFRAQYALIKELTKQVVCDMDQDQDLPHEVDARELIAGGQPISSIFSRESIPNDRNSRLGEGKTKNGYGDQLIYDGEGILHQEDSDQVYGNPEYGDDLVLDNAELAQFGSTQDPWLPGIPRWTLKTDDDQWCKSWVTSRDVEEALRRVAEPKTIKDRTERALILCANQERAQQEYWIRQAFRRRFSISRWRAREFYMNGERMAQPPWKPTEDDPVFGKDVYIDNDLCSLRIKKLDRNEEPDFIQAYHDSIKDEIQKQWPNYPDLAKAPDRFSTLIRKKYKWHDLAVALAPTRSDIPEAILVVKRLFDRFFSLRELLTPKRSSDAIGLLSDSPTLSSSCENAKEVPETESKLDDSNGDEHRSVERLDRNNKHKDCVTESGSSERLEALGDERGCNKFEAAALWPDVGRGVIYQTVQESMNELLDPMFELREALALEVTKTGRERELWKDEIGKCFHDDFAAKVMNIFRLYQKKWYQTSRERFDPLTSSESIKFVKFVLRCFEEPEFRDIRPSVARMCKSEHTDSAILQQAIHAFTRDKCSAIASERQSAIAKIMPAVVDDSQDAVFALDDIDVLIEETKHKPLESLLASAGYGIVTPPVEDFDGLDTSLLSSPGDPSLQDTEEDEPDPMLPQNRPGSLVEPDTQHCSSRASPDIEDVPQPLSGKDDSEQPELDALPPLSDERLLMLAVWNLIEADDLSRGGRGRINFRDFEFIMDGNKGQSLDFDGLV